MTNYEILKFKATNGDKLEIAPLNKFIKSEIEKLKNHYGTKLQCVTIVGLEFTIDVLKELNRKSDTLTLGNISYIDNALTKAFGIKGGE